MPIVEEVGGVIVIKVKEKGPQGFTGADGAPGTDGADGADGLGVPAGGAIKAMLRKVSVADNATEWSNEIGQWVEGQAYLNFTAGAATLNAATCENSQILPLTQNSAVTISVASPVNKPITLLIAHQGGPWTLSWAGTDLELEGAAGEIEYVLLTWDGFNWYIIRGGVVDLII